jgi:endonuclease YncB( thermonuclease family)
MMLLTAIALVVSGASGTENRGLVAWVIDGDTFRLSTGEKIRIAGIDAPESAARNAKCPTEITRGKAATRRAVALLKGRAVTFERVGRSYDRTVARVRLDGRGLDSLLVAQGVARWWPRGRPKPDWCR